MSLNLTARLGADISGFKQNMEMAKGIARSWSADLRNTVRGNLAGAFTAGALGLAGKEAVEYGGKIADAASKIKLGVGSLQEMTYAAEQNGGSLDDVVNAFRVLGKARKEALEGNSEKLNAFAAMGIDEAALGASTIEQIFKRIAATIEATDFGAGELVLVEQLLGKAGGNLIPMMKSGLEASAQEARNLGIVLSDEVIQQLDNAGDSIDKFKARLRGPAGELTGWLAQRGSDLMDFGKMGVGGLKSAITTAFSADGSIVDRMKAGARAWGQTVDDVVTQYGRDKGILSNPNASKDRTLKDASDATGETQSAAVKEAARVLELKQKILAIQRQAKSEEQQKSELEKQAAALRAQIAALTVQRQAGIGGVKESDILERQVQLAEAGAKLKQMADKARRGIESDNLLAVGNFLGAVTNRPDGEAAPAAAARMAPALTYRPFARREPVTEQEKDWAYQRESMESYAKFRYAGYSEQSRANAAGEQTAPILKEVVSELQAVRSAIETGNRNTIRLE